MSEGTEGGYSPAAGQGDGIADVGQSSLQDVPGLQPDVAPDLISTQKETLGETEQQSNRFEKNVLSNPEQKLEMTLSPESQKTHEADTIQQQPDNVSLEQEQLNMLHSWPETQGTYDPFVPGEIQSPEAPLTNIEPQSQWEQLDIFRDSPDGVQNGQEGQEGQEQTTDQQPKEISLKEEQLNMLHGNPEIQGDYDPFVPGETETKQPVETEHKEDNNDVITLQEQREIADPPPERKPINSDYAGRVFHPEKLGEQYPEGVKFTEEGYPDFSPYAKYTVKFDVKGNRTTDYDEANKLAGLTETPDGYVWHHHEDCNTMQLVPEDLHGSVRHTGGVAIIKRRNAAGES